ncbi:MAG: class I SAM-dependent methyltransferase [Candidatus Omnitrophica bacterium]|nr:class I SAM-dependent methyltransferase [Candidatus Omnitrophota bacterium]
MPKSLDHLFVKLIGWKATVLHGDPCVYDRWRWLKKRLRPGPLRTLDVGCGSGAFTLYTAKRGNEAVGISFDERNNRAAAERAEILRIQGVRFLNADLGKLNELSKRLGSFDQILCLETIEHIRDDRKLLRDMSALLKPGGRLLLTTPFEGYRRLIGDRLSSEEDGGHVRWGYGLKLMRDLFEEAGLEMAEQAFISGFVSQQLTNLMRILSWLNPRAAWILTFPLRILWVLDRPVSWLLCYPYLCIGVVGEKREMKYHGVSLGAVV